MKDHGKSWLNIFARIVVGSLVGALVKLIRL